MGEVSRREGGLGGRRTGLQPGGNFLPTWVLREKHSNLFFWAVDTLTLLAFCVTLHALMLYGVTLHAVVACFMRPRSWLHAGAHADDRGHVSDGDGAARRAAAPPAEEAQDRQEAHPLHPGIGRPPVGQQGEIRSSCGILHEVYTRYAAVAAQGQMFVRPGSCG